jgi:hypothetical protein
MRWKYVVGAFLLSLILIGAFVGQRRRAMKELYTRATAGGTDRVAIENLAQYKGDFATDLLLQIALNPNSGSPEKAIQTLAGRRTRDLSGPLSILLQPHSGLELRLAVADLLLNHPCSPECVDRILHYRERLWRGEPNYEDHFANLSNTKWDTGAIAAKQKMLLDELARVLLRERRTTLRSLEQTYGLGYPYPSSFSVDLVGQLGLIEACPDLQTSLRESDRDTSLREGLENQLIALKCNERAF